ncbi:MAG: hypothetical protein ACO1OG_09495 [Devosia sp.]
MASVAVAEEISPATDRLLWCSSAMYWLSADAYDAGEDEEAAQYETWSDDLAARADLMLESEGRSGDELVAIRDEFDNRVLAELGGPSPKYDVTACPDLAAQ